MAAMKLVSDLAVPAQRAPGAPLYSDVCFSSRWKHPLNPEDPHETFRDAEAFHATRLDWVYSSSPAWIKECKQRGYRFTGALNMILLDAPGLKTREQGRILDKQGQPVAAPWMRAKSGFWGCVNSPQYRQTFLAHARLLIDGGADGIQMDDPRANEAAIAWGGCFCEYCLSKAARQSLALARDMQAFQTESVREFYADMRSEVDRYAGRRVPWSCNNSDGKTGFPYDLFDYGMAELREDSATPAELYRKIAEATKRGRQQIFTFVSNSLPLTRRVIATAYACGGHILVPYDVYFGNKQPRIFGKAEEYADLYGFVRANAACLDGYEDAAACGPGLADTRYESPQPVETNSGNVFAFVRARPGNPASPMVIHLIDWREAPQPFVLRLATGRFSSGGTVRARLRMPSHYDAALHTAACAQKEYAALKKEREMQIMVKGELMEISIPALDPWGALILYPGG
jgi:hypothetical protein